MNFTLHKSSLWKCICTCNSVWKIYHCCNFSGCLLLVLPQSSEVEIPKTLIFDEWLTQEVNNRSNGTYYFSAEFDQVDLKENSEVTVGTGHGLKVGKWGEMQDPVLKIEMGYRLGLVLILEYNGVYSVGYTETHDFYIDY
ncbi:uncharacterized protein LOC110838232 [Zootermopsis nevadensis]|uniref:uncharacterized protein LOC110838232 n=1 Tax=Zootermopsis nevadensis TaxID=136037 RepID=UPI000B8E40E8|nr:uncharacterized protein LOC110838232 [Zootermopsis nevadensis]